MPHVPQPLRPRRALAVLVLALNACEVPAFDGPQIQSPPPAFSLNAEVQQERRLFPDLEVTHHDAWVEASWGNFSGIYINGHPVTLGRADAEAAREAAMQLHAGGNVEYGEMEELTVDERTAWGWTEWWRLENGGLQYVAYRAVIPYDTVSFAVEFLTGEPGLKIRPDSLRTVVASFAVGKTTWNVPLIVIMSGVLLLLLNAVRSRQAAKAARARSIRLVQVPKKDDKDSARRPAGGGSPATPAQPSGGVSPSPPHGTSEGAPGGASSSRGDSVSGSSPDGRGHGDPSGGG